MPDPCTLPVLGQFCDAAGNAAAVVAKSAFEALAQSFADGFSTAIKTMTTFWVKVPTPDLAGASSPVVKLQGSLYWLQGFVLVLSLLWTAGRMALDRSGKPAGEAARGLAVMVVAVGAGVAAIDTLTVAGDEFSTWIVGQSGHDLTAQLGALTGGSGTLKAAGAAVMFVVALLGIASCIVQVFLLLARVAILTLLAGSLPVSAAGAGTAAGRVWFQRVLAWIVAFVLYKPVAAFVYFGAFTLTGDGQDLTSVLAGLLLIILSVLALPGLMRLVTPMVTAATSGGGGGAVAGAVGGAALATGARQVSQRSSSSGGSGSGPGGGSSGGGSGRAGLTGGGPSGSSNPGSGSGGTPSGPGAGPSGNGAAASGSTGSNGAGAAGAGAGTGTGGGSGAGTGGGSGAGAGAAGAVAGAGMWIGQQAAGAARLAGSTAADGTGTNGTGSGEA